MKKSSLFGISLLALLAWTSCTKEEAATIGQRKFVLPEQVASYDEVPDGLPFDPFNGVAINNHQATLGRVLFYEKALSKNYSVSCGTCHVQARAFSDNFQFSKGFQGKLTDRNTPSIVNLGLQTDFFWDMRENVLGDMVLQPVAHPIEMGLDDTDEMVARIAAMESYDSLFIRAFGDAEVTVERLSLALEQFSRAMVSVRSKFDEGQRVNFANFTESELRGKDLFFVGLPCSGCHGGHVLAGAESQPDNIGLDEHYRDPGVAGINPVSNVERNGFFKTPSLRNIELTAPYMHDGRFKTLEEVIEFYNSGVQRHPQLSFMLRKNTNGGFFFMGHDPEDVYLNELSGVEPLRMHMTNQQKADLLAFLKTLTDNQLMTDPKFSDPFVSE
jgi:cytochrome c peroxidase